jgi:hypothetical protein
MPKPRLFSGIHVGSSGLYGICLNQDGDVFASATGRFSTPQGMVDALLKVVATLRQADQETLWTLALEKPHRLLLAPRNPSLESPEFRPEIVQPALSSVLLGAVPGGPGLLLSLGKEVRFALIDSTLTYREYRINEGGGTWWQSELLSLAQHSTRLQTHLKEFGEGKPPLRAVPRLLELGRYPAPDPALKPRLEKIARRLGEMAYTVTARLPGLQRYALSGYLADSALGELIKENLNNIAPHLKFTPSRFPPEVGSALVALAQEKENWERTHLGKPIFQQDRTVDGWAPPQELIRRLFKIRKPFERFGT